MQIGDKVSGCVVKNSGRSISISVKEGVLEQIGNRWSIIKVRGKAVMVETETLKPLAEKNFLNAWLENKKDAQQQVQADQYRTR